ELTDVECARPRAQQLAYVQRSEKFISLRCFHIAAPEDGRTPAKACAASLIPVVLSKCAFRRALAARLGVFVATRRVRSNSIRASWPCHWRAWADACRQ